MGEKLSAASKLKKTLDIRIALAVSDAFTAGMIFNNAATLQYIVVLANKLKYNLDERTFRP